MQIAKKLIAGAALAAAVLFVAPAVAQQPQVNQEVEANANVNVRNAPNGAILDVMRTGERGIVVARSGNWCDTLRHVGVDGWIFCSYLTPLGFAPQPPSPQPPSPSPDVSIEFSIPGFSFSIGDGGFGFRPGRPGVRGEVCFYENTNFRGASICARPGQQRASLGAWDNRISSIRVTGGAEALVCERRNFRGRCHVVDRSVRTLGPRGNNAISSYRVR